MNELLNTLLAWEKLPQKGLLEPEFYNDFVNKLMKISGNPDFSEQFEKINNRSKKIRYNVDVMRLKHVL